MEAYRFIRTNLEFASLETNGAKSVLVTSPGPTEGKTTTAARLAIVIASDGHSVILVDCDLRRPQMHELFGVENDRGLTNVLLKTASLPEVIVDTEVDNLRLVCTGPLPADPARVLRSPAFRATIAELASMAEYTFIDSPPLLAVTDPLLLVNSVDAVILVVDATLTKRSALQRATDALSRAKPPLVGTVLNRVRPTTSSGYGYGYYYSSGNDRKPSGRWRRPWRSLLRRRR